MESLKTTFKHHMWLPGTSIAAFMAAGLWFGIGAAPPNQPENPSRDVIPKLTAPTIGGQPIGPGNFDSGRVELRIGPIKNLTTGWHKAPTQTDIPVGSVVLLEANGVDANDLIAWSGAVEVARTSNTSLAICPLVEIGMNIATVEVNSGGILESRQIVFDAVNFDPANITITPIQVQTGSIAIDPILTGDALNQQTMMYFFGDSIATVIPTGIDQYRTSIDNAIGLSVQVTPSGFAPLMEWRVDGLAKQLGASVGQKISNIGMHTVAVGPPNNSLQIGVETYSVTITSHVTGDIISEGTPITYQAVTDPPGYESQITWLSSTKYGTGTPVLGLGATFTTQFDNTWGPWPQDPDSSFQWLGVKAGNVVFNLDQKCTPLNCDDGDPCTTDTCVAGVCVHTPVNCDDGNPCTVDACVNGICQNVPIVCGVCEKCVDGVCVDMRMNLEERGMTDAGLVMKHEASANCFALGGASSLKDCLVTPGPGNGGTTVTFFGINGAPPIPADFFAPGSDPFVGTVALRGTPLVPEDPACPGADTVIQRSASPFVLSDLPGIPRRTVDIEIVALSLVSVAPITVTFNGGQNPEQWNVAVDLSQVAPVLGILTATKTHCNGGTFSSNLNVQPRFTFTNVIDPLQVRTLDTGLAGIAPTTMDTIDSTWIHGALIGIPSLDFIPGLDDPTPTLNCSLP